MTGTRTTPIHDRDDDNRTRSKRLKQIKRGPGWFVYEGGHNVVSHHPTIKRTKKREPVMDDEGNFATDHTGRLVYREAGDPVLDHEGKPKLGGKPKAVISELEHFSLWGESFARGEPRYVENPALALKLRCLGACRELSDDEAGALAPDGAEMPKPKRGRKPKQEVASVDEVVDDEA